MQSYKVYMYVRFWPTLHKLKILNYSLPCRKIPAAYFSSAYQLCSLSRASSLHFKLEPTLALQDTTYPSTTRYDLP